MNDLILKKGCNKDNEILKYENIFENLMFVYKVALNNVKNIINNIGEKLKEEYNYEIIKNVKQRIKTKESILGKLEKKGYDFTYKSLIEKINDVAGVRIICVTEKDVYKVVKKILERKDINIIKKKDYIKNPKKSGYSSYHIIIGVPVIINAKEVWIKIEIQIMTMAMDLWANMEHEAKYKVDKKINKIDSYKFKKYARMILYINKKMEKIYNRLYA